MGSVHLDRQYSRAKLQRTFVTGLPATVRKDAMTPDKFRDACAELGIVAKYDARRVLGITPEHASRLATGHKHVSATMAALLAALLKIKDYGIPLEDAHDRTIKHPHSE